MVGMVEPFKRASWARSLICWTLLITMCLLQIFFAFDRRRETDVKPGFHCQDLEGDSSRSNQVSASVFQIIGYELEQQSKPSMSIQPEIAPFVFPNVSDYVLSCVKLHMFFYNMLLKLFGFGSAIMITVRARRECFRWRELWPTTAKTDFDKDNPVPQQKSKASNFRMLMALNLMSAATSNSTFNLVSDLTFHRRMRRYRGFQGMLDSTKLSQPDLLALRQVIQFSDDQVPHFPSASDDSFTAIADSGCSFT